MDEENYFSAAIFLGEASHIQEHGLVRGDERQFIDEVSNEKSLFYEVVDSSLRNGTREIVGDEVVPKNWTGV